jgi:tetratricopeptide (TPR) repeat protein
MGQPEAALASAHASVRKNSENMEGWMLLAELSAEQGDDAAALSCLRPALESSPVLVRAWAWLAEMEPRLKSGLPVEEILTKARSSVVTEEDYATTVFALANLRQRAGLYSEAFGLYQEANQRLDAVQPFAIEAWEARVAEIIASSEQQAWTPPLRNQREFVDHARLVFICGMPRSGTSLCEQILCSHPAVHGAGELPSMEYIEKCLLQRGHNPYGTDETGWQAEMRNVYLDSLPPLNKGESWVIDKTPRNFERLDLVLRLFPEARVLWMLRHPLDTVLSCFFQDFASSQDYTRRLDHTTRVYIGHLNLLRHWKQKWGESLKVVDYSELVQNLETAARSLADFLSLDFHPAMLRPHLNPRPVRTSSAAQVRRPVYTTSLNQWRRYAGELSDLMARMQAEGLIDAEGQSSFSI